MSKRKAPTRWEIVKDIAWILSRFLLGSIIYALVYGLLSPLLMIFLIGQSASWFLDKIESLFYSLSFRVRVYPLKDSPIGYLKRAIRSTKVLFNYKEWRKGFDD